MRKSFNQSMREWEALFGSPVSEERLEALAKFDQQCEQMFGKVPQDENERYAAAECLDHVRFERRKLFGIPAMTSEEIDKRLK